MGGIRGPCIALSNDLLRNYMGLCRRVKTLEGL